MGFLSRAAEARSGLATPSPWLIEALGGARTRTGVSVSAESALTHSAVFQAVRLISESIASLPLVIHRRDPQNPRRKTRATDHPLYALLHDQPNEVQTSFEFVELMQARVFLRGNAFALPEFDRGGRVVSLWPINPDEVTAHTSKTRNGVDFIWTPPGERPVSFHAGDGTIMHWRGFAPTGGFVGISVIEYAREALGVTLAADEYAGRMFANDSTPASVLQAPGDLGDEAQKRLRASVEEFRGLKQRHKTLILEQGLTWHQMGFNPQDTQMLESRKFGITDVARWFNIPPHKLADLDRATFSNIEHQSTEFVRDTLRPWLVRHEKSMKRDLLSLGERQTHTIEFVVDGLLRGDSKTRHETYAIGRSNGYLSGNDIRELENMDPVDGLDTYLIPLNMSPVGEDEDADEPDDEPDSPETDGEEPRSERRAAETRSVAERLRLGEAFEPVYREAAERLVRGERRDLLQAAKKVRTQADLDQFADFLVSYYDEAEGAFPKFATRTLEPAFVGLAGAVADQARGDVDPAAPAVDLSAFTATLVASFVARYAGRSKAELGSIEVQSVADMPGAVERLTEGWHESRVKSAVRETVKTRTAAARATYQRMGVERLRWVASAGNCGMCAAMDGREQVITSPFSTQGETVDSEDPTITPLQSQNDIFHPPLHRGCRCDIVPA